MRRRSVQVARQAAAVGGRAADRRMIPSTTHTGLAYPDGESSTDADSAQDPPVSGLYHHVHTGHHALQHLADAGFSRLALYSSARTASKWSLHNAFADAGISTTTTSLMREGRAVRMVISSTGAPRFVDCRPVRFSLLLDGKGRGEPVDRSRNPISTPASSPAWRSLHHGITRILDRPAGSEARQPRPAVFQSSHGQSTLLSRSPEPSATTGTPNLHEQRERVRSAAKTRAW